MNDPPQSVPTRGSGTLPSKKELDELCKQETERWYQVYQAMKQRKNERDLALELPNFQRRATATTTNLPAPAEAQNAASNISSVIAARQPPAWYLNVQRSTRRDGTQINVDTLLSRLRDSVKRSKERAAKNIAVHDEIKRARELVHKLVFEKVDKTLLRERRILHNEDGLPQIFDPAFSDGVAWPCDIKSDAEELYNRWCAQIFENDLLRGILVHNRPGTNKIGHDYSIDPKYDKSVMDANSFGNGQLLNGQWWPRQLCLVRDGAHGATQAGIHGADRQGVYSIIVSGGDYPDIDEGDRLFYCGTDSTDGKLTLRTQWMLNSVGTALPVRVFRSSSAKSYLRPQVGFRYDGLYLVCDFVSLDGPRSTRQRHRFTLIRVKGQDPIRGGDIVEARPTHQEVKAYHEHKMRHGS